MMNNITEFYNRIEDSTLQLGLIPDVLQTLIDDLNLEERELTLYQQMELSRSHKKLYSVLTLAQLTIWETLESLDKIYHEEVQKPRETD